MAVQPEGTPCWVDAMFTDVEAAKRFYGDVLGWTFGESAPEFGGYTQAYADGKAVAAVSPPMPGQESPPAWCLYIASADASATAAKIRDAGGQVDMDPMEVGDFGTMLIARDPSGVSFGVWQAGSHEGFEARGETGAFAWAEVFTREPEKSDAFWPTVFSYRAQRMEDDKMDFRIFNLGDNTVLGRMKMGDDFPPEVPPYINVYFGVADCDAAVAKATQRGGKLQFGPMDTPFGRFAALSDPQGAAFSVIDMTTTQGDMPKMSDVS
ncbi:VOC family protein [Streptomyces sp. A3M-1-3]|uniref:VOC family protein n=1 Tax=Streptomyces sp. A3M-1-3 TaxID=2962044 RepID=UPI0020B7D320|nr:VOC family protein [Streptomyces sp. A3M-1-3]MCP3818154.1 VOC family protein [Streptomyces sp. A3M-1-3]